MLLQPDKQYPASAETMQIRVRGRRVCVWRLKVERFRGDTLTFLRVSVTAVTAGTSPCVFKQKNSVKNGVGV
jgi:hypothetical protein